MSHAFTALSRIVWVLSFPFKIYLPSIEPFYQHQGVSIGKVILYI